MKLSLRTIKWLMGLSFISFFMGCQPHQDITTAGKWRAQAGRETAVATIFGQTVPANIATNDNQAITIGMKFKSNLSGNISGIRVYRGVSGPTTLKAKLWTNDGTQLATGTLSLPDGVTEPGWFEVPFDGGTPVPITANVVYVASYYTPIGQYAYAYEGLASDVQTPNAFGGVLTALGSTANGGNGLYLYNNEEGFPNATYRNSNYFVDVLFSANETVAQTYKTANIFGNAQPAKADWNDGRPITVGVKFKSSIPGKLHGIRLYRGITGPTTLTVKLWREDGGVMAEGTLNLPNGVTEPGWFEVPFSRVNGDFPAPGTRPEFAVQANTVYVASYYDPNGFYAGENEVLNNDVSAANVFGGTLTALGGSANGGNGVYAYDNANTFPTNSYRNSSYFVDVLFTANANIFGNAVPVNPSATFDTAPITVGMKFKSSTDGFISGIRFYRAAPNNSAYSVALWSATGELLAEGFISPGEGQLPGDTWLEVPLTQNFQRVKVPITANTVYVATYYCLHGKYPYDYEGLAQDVTKPNAYGGVLTALGGVTNGGNGVYKYATPNPVTPRVALNEFPTESYRNSNYYVDVLFDKE